MTFWELITENWPQLTVFFGVIGGVMGYILKAIFNFLLRKKEIEFTRLHELRAEKIGLIFQSLADMEHSFNRYLSQVHNLHSLEAEKSLFDTARASLNDFKKMIHANELYFEQSTNEKLKNISKSYSEALLNSYTIFDGDEESEEIWREKGKRTLDILNSETIILKRKLKKQFQTLIGI